MIRRNVANQKADWQINKNTENSRVLSTDGFSNNTDNCHNNILFQGIGTLAVILIVEILQAVDGKNEDFKKELVSVEELLDLLNWTE